MIYQQLIDNALWGYVQPKDGWKGFATKAKEAEDESACRRAAETTGIDESGADRSTITKLDTDYRALDGSDSLQQLVKDPMSNIFVTVVPHESKVAPVFGRSSFVDDICFRGQSFEDCLATLDILLVRFTECRISISFTKSIFAQSQVDFLSHKVNAQGIAADPTKLMKLVEWPFSTLKGYAGFS